MYRLLAAAVFSSFLFGQSAAPDDILRQAVGHQQSGDFDAAIRGYREYLKIRPDAVNALSNLGAALAHQGRYQEAIAEYEKALNLAPAVEGIRVNLALAYYKSGEISRAVALLEQIHQSHPDNLQAVLLLGDCRLRLGENAKVVSLLTPLDDAAHQNLAIAYMLGTALIRDKQVDKGQILIDRILKNGDSAEARLLMGTTKLTVGDFAGARDDLKKAVEENPKLPDVYSYYGLSLMRTGDQDSARAAFLKELESNPNDFTSNLNLGVLLKQDQKYREAAEYLDRALLVRAGDPGVRYQLATIREAKGRNEEAARALEALVKESPGFTEAHVSLAAVYYRLKRKADGDRERAIAQKLTAAEQAKQPGALLDAKEGH